MKIKTLALVTVIAVSGFLLAHAADPLPSVKPAATDPRIDKLIQQNEQIIRNQADIKQQLEKLSQEIMQLRRRSS